MQPKIIKPTVRETVKFGRRSFMRKVALATGGAAFCLPNLIINPVYAGTALIVDSSGDKRIELTNAAIARAFDIGTWTKLRLGCRLMCTGTATTASVTPRLVIGLQSGEADLVLDASSVNFFGMRTAGAVWTFNNYTDDTMTTNGTNVTWVTKKVGSTWTDNTSSGLTGANFGVPSTNSSATKNSLLLVEITKGSPNYTLAMISHDIGTILNDVTRATLLSKMTDVTLTAPSTHTLWSAQPLAFNETAGTLDHVAIGWDRTEFAFQFSDIAVSKIVQ